VIRELEGELSSAGIQAEISGRPKHLYSIYTKLNRYIAQGKGFGDIHDLVALRVIVGSAAECYQTLGIAHRLWHPLTSEFNDYIANPKENGYRSLHTTVMCQGIPLEIQARTKEMNWQAEYGIASHWSYKEGGGDVNKDRIAWLRQLLQWHKELKGARFVDAVKTDLFPEQVFVFTPKGEIKELQAGATPLDFAYRVHTDLGHRCVGSKVNNRMVPLDYELQNGDIVEILAAKKAKGPSRDWLNLSLGYVKTSHAREKIRHWFAQQEKGENIQRGREFLEREFRRLGLGFPSWEELGKAFHFERLDDFLLAVANGELSPRQVAQYQTAAEAPHVATTVAIPTLTEGIQVLGQSNLLTKLAKCCHPIWGDEVIGYITRNRGVTIHRQDCYNVLYEKERERLIPVQWPRQVQVSPVEVVVR
ncbi:MAG: TGS domain-containing protein, partial [Chloroflexota bacterium]